LEQRDRSETLAELRDVDSRVVTADDIASFGYSVDWQKHTLDELQHIKKRLSIAEYLARLGDSVDWQDHTLDDLRDRSSRVWIATELARKCSHHVDWKEHSFAEMESMRDRIQFARFLTSYYGYQLDWREYDVGEMQETRSRIILANNLARRGRKVDWREVTLPPNPYEGLELDVAAHVRELSRRSGVSPKRILAIVHESQEILANESIDVDQASLLSAARDIFSKVRWPIAECLTRYMTHRREGMDHLAAVEEAIPKPVKPAVKEAVEE
jgi:hypothetical protein